MTPSPVRPTFPPSRMVVERGMLGVIHFESPAHYDAWKAQSWLRRWFWFVPKPPTLPSDDAAPHDD